MIEQMRANLVPKGTKPVVRLSLNAAAYFDYDFITKCIDTIEMKAPMVSAGLAEFSPLEILAMELLKDSAAN
jgi:hypothetical protein